MIVMGIAWVIWGFIAKRFVGGGAAAQGVTAASTAPGGSPKLQAATAPMSRSRLAPAMTALAILMALAGAAPAAGQTLQRVRDNGSIRLGYRTDARPLSFQNESGAAAGYSVALCQGIVEAAKAEVSRPDLSVVWVPVTAESRYRALAAGEIDLLCGAETETLSRRGQASFSIPIFPGGIGAVVRRDAAERFKDVLSGRQPAFRPNWRATAGQVLLAKKFAVVGGTTAEQWLADKRREFDLVSEVVRVDSYEAGVQSVLDGKADAFFGDRVLLLDAGKRSSSPEKLTVLDRMFTVEPVALAMARGDDDFRLFVDRTLSKLVASGKAAAAYEESLGKPDEAALTFLRTSALPD
jgi:ABC-type amino acid transport substrate-binding protein